MLLENSKFHFNVLDFCITEYGMKEKQTLLCFIDLSSLNL